MAKHRAHIRHRRQGRDASPSRFHADQNLAARPTSNRLFASLFSERKQILLFLKKNKQKDFCFLALVGLLGWSVSAWAAPRDDAARKLQDAEQLRAARLLDQQKAAQAVTAAQEEALRLSEQRVQAAAALRKAEENIATAAARLRAAETASADAEAALRQRTLEFTALVPLMLRMSRYPAETVLAIPAPPERALQGILLTSGIAATLNQRAAALREQAQNAQTLRGATEQEATTLRTRQDEEEASAAALDKAMEATKAKLAAAEAAGREAAELVAALGAQAATLRDAISAMDAARAAAVARAAREADQAVKSRQEKSLADARAKQASLARPAARAPVGRFVAPITAPIQRPFGAAGLGGPAAGITYAPAPGAYVVSPCAGRVAFAAPFRSYGQLIILECGGGMDVVLAGLGQIDTAPGRAVHAAEPLGRTAQGGKPTLYMELRAKGEPVNPMPFLNARS
jgi:septal ring factor EnvC (AmiA/AmiB activator)